MNIFNCIVIETILIIFLISEILNYTNITNILFNEWGDIRHFGEPSRIVTFSNKATRPATKGIFSTDDSLRFLRSLASPAKAYTSTKQKKLTAVGATIPVLSLMNLYDEPFKCYLAGLVIKPVAFSEKDILFPLTSGGFDFISIPEDRKRIVRAFVDIKLIEVPALQRTGSLGKKK